VEEEVQLLETPHFERDPNNLICGETSLEKAKARVGDFKLRYGDKKWKENVTKVDRRVHFANVLQKDVVSRAYFKMIEMLRTMAIGDMIKTSLHLCEAPGGFAQAAVSEISTLHSAVIMSSSTNGAPYFAPTILKHPKIDVLKQMEMNGDITHPAVRDSIVQYVKPNSVDLITADGAIDNDAQPELTEQTSALIIACEIATALRTQSENGTFIVKMFTINHAVTKEMIAILSYCYNSVCILKPYTSRAVNDERYIVCQHFSVQKSKSIRFPNLSRQGAFLRHIATYTDGWSNSLDDIVATMAQQQRRALEAALTLRSTSRDETSKISGRPRGRGGRMPQNSHQASHPYRGRGRGPPPIHTS
jgi:23S rRNA U2552 (ribose-2'-O)-methylase RlmE/FtsJ